MTKKPGRPGSMDSNRFGCSSERQLLFMRMMKPEGVGKSIQQQCNRQHAQSDWSIQGCRFQKPKSRGYWRSGDPRTKTWA